jgi:hypothetical protein
MKKRFLAFSAALLLTVTYAVADEGMWMANLLDKQLYQLMKSKGLKLSPAEIYNENGGALSDAIIAIDGGSCSGSIISPNGLMITNHHCAYGDVHALSTPEKNYLEDGFWAMKMDDERPIKGKTVTFLRRVKDVTEETHKLMDSLDKIGPRGIFFMRKVSGILEDKYKTPGYEVGLSSMWRGEKYYLYFMETYTDVRLVGAPPVSVGAFGGETDNWGWPQHKGDFAMYRVYAGKDGKPAEYSSSNVPLKANRYLTISTKGVKENDYTMILGYPGRTNRYTSSFELKEKYDILNPVISGVRRAKLDVWKKYMDGSDAIRLKYSDKYFGISNYTDYAKWENICINRFDIIEKIAANEAELQNWINAKPERVAKYGKMLENLKKGYETIAGITKIKEYFRESIVRGAEFTGNAQRFNTIASTAIKAKKDSISPSDSNVVYFYKKVAKPAFESSDVTADRELFKVMLRYYVKEVPASYMVPEFKELLAKCDNSTDKLADYVYDNSVLTDPARLDNFFKVKRGVNEILADPMIIIVKSSGIVEYNRTEDKLLKDAGLDMASLRTDYTHAMYEMNLEKGNSTYPDANSTMRLTYGTVGGINARDAVYYGYQTTTAGILEKIDPTNYEFKVKPGYEAALNTANWGKWGQNGKLYVNFLSDNDITGGNSGSAVLNAKGELIGLAFDGNRESMAGNAYFVNGYNKCVNVDIRYIMWVIDKYCGAGYLLNEMKFSDK